QKRYAESIQILEPLVHDHPDTMTYRALLIVAYFHSSRGDEMKDLVKQTDEYFHKDGRWTEGNIAMFGNACLDCDLAEKASGYLNEAIALHQRANNQRVLNDGTLSEYYRHLAQAESKLKHTKLAVDAASSAVVCWGPTVSQRADALNNLRAVLASADDLTEYVKQWDAEVAKTGQDSPILRKAIGQVYQQQANQSGDNEARRKASFEKAVEQLKLAADLQGNDKELYEALLNCYDALKKNAEATKQLEQLIAVNSHEIDLYRQLARRLNDEPAEAERAITSIVEVGAKEAENHQALAEYRQQQNRWDEAIDQWQDVAKLRSLEPNGLLRLAEAQLHQKQWDAARKTIEKLERTEWPSRFGNTYNEANNLQQRLQRESAQR
ncbi:MAG TPA: tetratricopeptide repeat protein, partial [Pirellulales bacterium]